VKVRSVPGGGPNNQLQRSAGSKFLNISPVPFPRPLNWSVRPSRSDRGEAEWHRCGVEEAAGAEELAKAGMPN
jgi:hypothetical protein